MPNPFVHVELHAGNLGQEKEFYRNLFDWTVTDLPQTDYAMIDVGEGTGGGMGSDPDGAARWLPYVLVSDIRMATDKARSLGGTVQKEVTEIPGMGWYSVIIDPAGAALGMWQSRPEPKAQSSR